jgi:hypothetical protein
MIFSVKRVCGIQKNGFDLSILVVVVTEYLLPLERKKRREKENIYQRGDHQVFIDRSAV